MNVKAEQSSDVLEVIQRQISQAEGLRRQRRFDYNLAALGEGMVQVLGSDEFVADLCVFLSESRGDKEQRRKVIAALGKEGVCPDRDVRERALAVLSLAVPQALQEQDREQLVLLAHYLGKWLADEEEILPGVEVLVKRIEAITDWLLSMSLWKDAAGLLAVLAGICSGKTAKNPALRSLVGRTLSNLASRPVVEKITDHYLHDGGDKEFLVEILRNLGKPATELLFQRGLACRDQTERQGLLQLFWTISGDTLAGFVAFQKMQPSTELLRDIIRFVAEKADETVFDALQQYFAYGDRQVQREMIRCAVGLGGRAMRTRLLDGLGRVEDCLKIPIIRLLAEHAGGDESIVPALCTAVEKRNSCAPPHVRDGLLKAVTIALRSFPCQQSMAMLRRLRQECQGITGGERLLLHIDQSLKTLAPQLRHSSKRHADTEDVAKQLR